MNWRKGMAALWMGFAVWGQAAEAPAAKEEEEKISPWDYSVSVGEAVGHKDNLLLSDFNQEASLFTLTTAELFLFRMPQDGWEFSLLGTAEDRRYWQSSTMDKEQLFLASMDLKKTFAEIWTPRLNLDYIYTDQIFDASISEGLPIRIQAKMHRFSAAPGLIVALPGKRRVESKWEIVRQNFELPLDDSWETGPRVLAGQKYGYNSDLTLSLSWRERSYDHLSVPSLGTSLRYTIRGAEAANRHYFDKQKAWSARTKAGVEWVEDNGTAENDYRRWRASEELGFEKGGFEGSAEAQVLQYEYSVQTGIDGRVRRRTELNLGLKLKQQICKGVRVFAAYELEWAMARDASEKYRASTFLGGIEWEIK